MKKPSPWGNDYRSEKRRTGNDNVGAPVCGWIGKTRVESTPGVPWVSISFALAFDDQAEAVSHAPTGSWRKISLDLAQLG